jgi:hypothetical protein
MLAYTRFKLIEGTYSTAVSPSDIPSILALDASKTRLLVSGVVCHMRLIAIVSERFVTA